MSCHGKTNIEENILEILNSFISPSVSDDERNEILSSAKFIKGVPLKADYTLEFSNEH